MSEKKYIRKSLSTATGLLLGGVAAPCAHAFGTDTPWELNAAVLYYGESDGRVQALEPVIMGRKELDDEEYLNLKLVVDSLTGATPTGAVPSSHPQTFTRPSGKGSYTIAAGEVPLDDTFHDTRTALSVDWEKALTEMTRSTFGANFSSEFDFQSLGLSATIDHDLNQRNTTLTAGIALETDTLEPEGGIPLELASAMVPAGKPQNRRDSSETRDQIDLLLGLTQVINERTLMQFNISHSESDGYHSDPFKFISIVQDASGPNQGEPLDNIYENRPDSRSKSSFFWKTLHSFTSEDVIDFSYRYLTDDWGIKSHTMDLRYTWMLDSGSYWQPHLRFYKQEAADFYRTLLPQSETVPEFISADYRLGDLASTTVGIKYSQMLASENLIEFRLELLTQTNDPSPGSRIGSQAGRQLILDTEASILQFTYTF
ncbi:MAG TPA: DUF3570 domain-containing protein [Gammaproteobacteria bacterium]|nr:DUF3570 domain-containing protein [Gammaproteobacteria bacterium]